MVAGGFVGRWLQCARHRFAAGRFLPQRETASWFTKILDGAGFERPARKAAAGGKGDAASADAAERQALVFGRCKLAGDFQLVRLALIDQGSAKRQGVEG